MKSLITLYSSKGRKHVQHIPIWVCLVSFLLLYFVAFCVSQEDALDLGRYYDSLQDKTQTSSIEEIVNMRMHVSHKYDFIYHIILFVSIKLSIPLNFVTASIVFVFFYSVCHLMFRICDKKIDYLVIIVVLLTTPLTWTVSISRNLTSIMFLTMAFVCFLKKKKIICLTLLVVSIFTHFGSALYLLIFITSIFLAKRRINPVLIFLILSVAFTASFAIPSSIRDVMVIFLDDESGYTHYFLDSGGLVFTSNSIRYGDKLPIAFSLFYSSFLLFFNKKQGYAFWLLLLSTIMLAFFLNFGLMFVNRIMLIMPLLWGLNVSLIYRYYSIQQVSSIKLISLIGIIPIVLHLYAYRVTYLLFWF